MKKVAGSKLVLDFVRTYPGGIMVGFISGKLLEQYRQSKRRAKAIVEAKKILRRRGILLADGMSQDLEKGGAGSGWHRDNPKNPHTAANVPGGDKGRAKRKGIRGKAKKPPKYYPERKERAGRGLRGVIWTNYQPYSPSTCVALQLPHRGQIEDGGLERAIPPVGEILHYVL